MTYENKMPAVDDPADMCFLGLTHKGFAVTALPFRTPSSVSLGATSVRHASVLRQCAIVASAIFILKVVCGAVELIRISPIADIFFLVTVIFTVWLKIKNIDFSLWGLVSEKK